MLTVCENQPFIPPNDISLRQTDEAACVAWLMRLYREKTAETGHES